MSVNGIGAGYPAWCDNADFASAGKAQRHGSGTDFAGRMADTDAVGNGSHVRNSAKAAGQTLVLDVLIFTINRASGSVPLIIPISRSDRTARQESSF